MICLVTQLLYREKFQFLLKQYTFLVDRKNWLFSGTPDGAKASALLYSLIETAKANNLEPYAYLRFLFEMLPVTSPQNLQKLLPTRLSPEDLILGDLTTVGLIAAYILEE